jgi:hypothetical protein
MRREAKRFPLWPRTYFADALSPIPAAVEAFST